MQNNNNPKFIFVTGGVVSGLGKGITAASVGLILKSNGYSVDAIKFDPYLNVDPGTMSPFEHGEVYVLEDGSECDLDLGHYERFLDISLDGSSSVSSGKIYNTILEKERNGEFLGKTVQLIPSVSNYIQECFEKGLESKNNHIRMIEIGGSIGDIEAEIFFESLRQFRQRHHQNMLHIHLGYIPFLHCTKEYKSKPMQNSLRELLRLGIQPDIVIGRFTHHTGYELDTKLLEKIAMFSNLEPSSVIAVPDLPSIYSVPNFLVNTQITKVLEKFLSSDNNKRGFLMPKPVKIQNSLPDFWQNIKDFQPTKSIRIGIVTKYTKLSDSYLSVIESLKLAGVEVSAKIEICLIDGDKLEENDAETWNILRTVGGILVPGGFGGRALVGKILAAKFARENIIPFLGICLGMQMAVTEFAQNVCGLAVTSREILENRDDVQVQECIIDYMPDQQSIERKGGTMRLGSYQCQIEPNSLAYSLFQSSQVKERHRHRLEVQSQYLDQLESYGMVVSGKFVYSEDSHQSFLPEMVELKSEIHPFYIGTQSHPEFLSRPGRPHPLFLGFIRAIVE